MIIEKLGSELETKRVFSNFCFTDAVSVDLFKSNPFCYVDALVYLATKHNLNVFEVEDYERTMFYLIKSINSN